MRLKEQIAILALGAGFAGCTPQPATNLIEDNMEFAQQQLRFAFDEIDYAIVNESPESRAKREKNGWGELTNPPQFGTGRDTELGAVQRLDKRILSGRTLVPLRIYPKQFLEKESPATY